jgi:hypothetical protein
MPDSYQYELSFPEYRFHVGDVVLIRKTTRYIGIPFEIIERRFRDPREHEVIDEDFRMRRTEWYYFLRSVHQLPSWSGGLSHKHRTVKEHNIEVFSWKQADSKWEA